MSQLGALIAVGFPMYLQICNTLTYPIKKEIKTTYPVILALVINNFLNIK